MQEDAWAVISAFFKAKGLVRQQLDSFNEFINSNMQASAFNALWSGKIASLPTVCWALIAQPDRHVADLPSLAKSVRTSEHACAPAGNCG